MEEWTDQAKGKNPETAKFHPTAQFVAFSTSTANQSPHLARPAHIPLMRPTFAYPALLLLQSFHLIVTVLWTGFRVQIIKS